MNFVLGELWSYVNRLLSINLESKRHILSGVEIKHMFLQIHAPTNILIFRYFYSKSSALLKLSQKSPVKHCQYWMIAYSLNSHYERSPSTRHQISANSTGSRPLPQYWVSSCYCSSVKAELSQY